jgi:putative transposase
MALWRLYYHFVWATKERQPLINEDRETALYNYIIGKADNLNCIIHAVGGIEDHIHIISSIPPTLAIADFVKHIKGSSAHYLNHIVSSSANKFNWQNGYGVFSLGGKQLDQAVTYVHNQKIHHLEKTAIAFLEKETHQDDPPNRWYSN